MARLTICHGCELGDHSRHYHVVQAVPEGMLGGSVCKCQGECVDGRYAPKHPWIEALAEAMEEASRAQT